MHDTVTLHLAAGAALQVIFALPAADGTDYAMRIFNSDGSEPEMCGNGIRCLARFVAGGCWRQCPACRWHIVRAALAPADSGCRRAGYATLTASLSLRTSSAMLQTWMARSRGSTRCTPLPASSSPTCWQTARWVKSVWECESGEGGG